MSNRIGSRDKTASRDSLHSVLQFARDVLDVAVSLLMFLLIAVLPFYFTDGFAHIGSDKHDFLYKLARTGGWVCLGIALVCLVLHLIVKYVCDRERIPWRKAFSVTDLFVFLFAGAVLLSYLHSPFREDTYMGEALLGNAFQGNVLGWYMGLCTQLIFVAIYFLVSRGWHCRRWMAALWMPVSFIVFLLGCLNRFGVFPISMKNETNALYISTIGNINWYCSYLVLVLFGVACYWWQKDGGTRWGRFLYPVYLFVGFMTLVTQGSSSGIVTLAVMLPVFYLLSVRDAERMESFWMLTVILGAACLAVRCVRLLFPESITYHEATTDLLTTGTVPWILCVVGLAGYCAVRYLMKKGRYPERFFLWCGRAGCIAAGVCAAGFLLLLVCNTLYPGSIGPLSEYEIFSFGPTWGSNRGATWMAGIQCFLKQDPAGMLLGVGPDCMAMYIHGGYDAALLQMVQDTFSVSLVLTNAHNEWLTMLVNCGILGAAAYIGIIISAIRRFWRGRKQHGLLSACALAILAYTVNNQFSFQQSMSTTTLFLMLGMGEALWRQHRRTDKKTRDV